MEDATLLERVLDSCRDDLDAAPAAFNAARLPDAQALYYLDKNVPVRSRHMIIDERASSCMGPGGL